MTSVRPHVPRTERTGPRDLLGDLVPDGVASLRDRRAPSGTEVGRVRLDPDRLEDLHRVLDGRLPARVRVAV